MKRIEVYDTTLRDGSQQSGISFSLHDRTLIMEGLLGIEVDYIELGFPGANKRDGQMFKRAKKMRLPKTKVVAFGRTCLKGKKPEDDAGLALLLGAETEIVAVVGKSSRHQVEKSLRTTCSENLRMIEETCRFLANRGRTVFFDAEHVFDGYRDDSVYTMECLKAAVNGGASRVILCDTNGGSLPAHVGWTVGRARKALRIPVGIHAHNDGDLATANSLAAVEYGADQVQVTINGLGERCGNADLFSVVAGLREKMGCECLPTEGMKKFTALSHFTYEIANLPPRRNQPYVGWSAFCHKGGFHGADPENYQHIDPGKVGNGTRLAVSDLAGGRLVATKAEEFGLSLTPEQAKQVLAEVERMEAEGFQFEAADASLELLMARFKGDYIPPFQITDWDVRSHQHGVEESVTSATIKVRISGSGKHVHEVADGDGPVNALDLALRKALLPCFPGLENVLLSDYKVRVINGERGTAKAVRVLVEFSNGVKQWETGGCSTNTIVASKDAVSDAYEYAVSILKAR